MQVFLNKNPNNEKILKNSFQKTKKDILNLKNNINFIKLNISEIKIILKHLENQAFSLYKANLKNKKQKNNQY